MIRQIVTHGLPAHLDELAGCLWLKWYGEKKLPGVSKAIFRPIQGGESVAELAARDDTILLGLGGGPYDEHAFNNVPAKEGECCATLVAKALGIDQDFCWRKTIKAVLHTDKNLPSTGLDLARTVVNLQNQGWGLNAVLHYTEIAISAAYEDQKAFSQTSLQNVREEPLTINGEPSFIAIAEEDNPNISRLMRFFGGAVVVIQNKTSHIQVLTNNQYHLDVRDILRVLRILELKKKGGIKKTLAWEDWKRFEEMESLEEVPEWYFHKDANNVLNGGQSRLDIPATKLSLTEAVGVVKISLEGHFEPGHEKSCREGKCTSVPPKPGPPKIDGRKPCSWYELGLLRCRRIRVKSNQK